jgi:hypothetical protein
VRLSDRRGSGRRAQMASAVSGIADAAATLSVREELARRRAEDEASLTQWISDGAIGPRPKPSQQTIAIERRYGEILDIANDAKAALPAAQQSLADTVTP